jgi:hypothetical protein
MTVGKQDGWIVASAPISDGSSLGIKAHKPDNHINRKYYPQMNIFFFFGA